MNIPILVIVIGVISIGVTFEANEIFGMGSSKHFHASEGIPVERTTEDATQVLRDSKTVSFEPRDIIIESKSNFEKIYESNRTAHYKSHVVSNLK